MPSHNLPQDAFQTFTTNTYNNPSPQVSQPIPVDLFATAIKDLPLDTLYSKALEIQNSISHLLTSNIEMKPFADEGDEVCKEAIAENDAVMERMEERIGLLKAEAESRGLRWGHGLGEDVAATTNGTGAVNGTSSAGAGANGERAAAPSGRLTDEELRRQLEAQMNGDEDEEGVHL